MKKIVITGGSGGIAQAIIQELSSKDYDIYAPTKNELDVTDCESIERNMRSFIPDILINNAGYIVPHSIRDCNIENTKKHIDINLNGVFYCTQIALKYNPHLHIINIGSAAAVETHPVWSEYCATKAAVVMAAKCWAADGLYAVTISPGRTRTKMRKSLFPNENPDTLLDPTEFAKIVAKAVNREYPSGSHILVKKDNAPKILDS